MSGKGSAPRPYSVKQEEFDAAWDRIFKKHKESMGETYQEYCKHDVWTHEDGKYKCLECGVTSEAGPYVSR